MRLQAIGSQPADVDWAALIRDVFVEEPLCRSFRGGDTETAMWEGCVSGSGLVDAG